MCPSKVRRKDITRHHAGVDSFDNPMLLERAEEYVFETTNRLAHDVTAGVLSWCSRFVVFVGICCFSSRYGAVVQQCHLVQMYSVLKPARSLWEDETLI